MSATTEYLDQCKLKLKIESDYALAKHFEISVQQMSNYRSNRNGADAVLAVKMAEVLNKKPLQIIADIQRETARSKNARDFWKKYSSAAAILIGMATIFVSNDTSAQSNILHNATFDIKSDVLYIRHSQGAIAARLSVAR